MLNARRFRRVHPARTSLLMAETNVRFTRHDLIHRLRCGSGNSRTIANAWRRQEAWFIQIVVAVTVAYECDVMVGEGLVHLEVHLIALDTAHGIEQELLTTPVPRFGSGNRFNRFWPTGRCGPVESHYRGTPRE